MNLVKSVCLIDWKMPEMDGIETTRQIRKIVGGEVPIVIISAPAARASTSTSVQS